MKEIFHIKLFQQMIFLYFGDALVAIINDKMPPEVPHSVREFLVECAELGGLELLDLYQEIIILISEYRKSK